MSCTQAREFFLFEIKNNGVVSDGCRFFQIRILQTDDQTTRLTNESSETRLRLKVRNSEIITVFFFSSSLCLDLEKSFNLYEIVEREIIAAITC